MRPLLLFLLLSHMSMDSQEYSMGAPDSACARMTPGHGFDPQVPSQGDPPARLRVDRRAVEPGGAVKVRVEAVQGEIG